MPKRLQVLVDRLIELLELSQRGQFVLTLSRVLWRHHVERSASAMAFSLFFAAIPLLALAGWWVTAVVQSSAQATESISSTFGLAPEQVHILVEQHVGRFSHGSVAPLVLGGALWLASGAFHTLLSAFETQLGARRRSWWRKRLLSLACVCTVLIVLGTIATSTVKLAGGPLAVLGLTGSDPREVRLAKLVAFGVGFVVMIGLVGALFAFGARRNVKDHRIWPGAFVTVTIGTLASYLFARYVEVVAQFAAYYGSLATVAVVLAWLWLCSAALFIGAEVNALLEGPVISKKR